MGNKESDFKLQENRYLRRAFFTEIGLGYLIFCGVITAGAAVVHGVRYLLGFGWDDSGGDSNDRSDHSDGGGRGDSGCGGCGCGY